MVQKARKWYLSSVGEDAAQEAEEKLEVALKDTQRITERAINVWAGGAISETLGQQLRAMNEVMKPFHESIVASQASALAVHLDTFSKLPTPLLPEGLFRSIGAIQGQSSVFQDVGKALLSLAPINEALLASQKSVLNLLSDSILQPSISQIVAANNSAIAEAIKSIQTLGISLGSQHRTLDAMLYPGVTTALTDVSRSFRDVTLSRSEGPGSFNEAEHRAELSRGLSIPTSSVVNFTNSLRFEVDEEFTQRTPDRALHTDDDLDSLLRAISPVFSDMHRGAWMALRSDNPDRWRQAAISQRELVRQVLEHLSPEFELLEGDPQSKLKSRVRRIITDSDSTATFATDVARAVGSLYQFLSKPTHTSYRREASIQAALNAGDALLLLLLTYSSSDE